MTPQQRRNLDVVARDLDLLVYRLEHEESPEGPEALERMKASRRTLRRDLEHLRDRLQDLVDDLW